MNAASFQAEAVFKRHGFARTILFIHSADLREWWHSFVIACPWSPRGW
jgi:hypothetical protein